MSCAHRAVLNEIRKCGMRPLTGLKTGGSVKRKNTDLGSGDLIFESNITVSSCGALDKSFSLSESPFPHVRM